MCDQKHVWLPAAMKASTREAGADVKDLQMPASGRWGLMVQSESPGKMGDSHIKDHLHLSVGAEVFIRRERGTE